MVTNIPIRLVRKDNKLIPLDVTELVLDVDRGVNARTGLTGGAKRFAIDLNRPKAVILLKGYVVDDEFSNGQGASSSSASVDFSRRGVTDYSWIDLMTPLGNSLDADDFSHSTVKKLTLKATDGEPFIIHFIKSSTVHGYNLGGSGKYHVSIHDTSSMRTTTVIAQNLANLINSSANGDALSSRFTASVHDSTLSDETNVMVKIIQDVGGEAGNRVVSWDNDNDNYIPAIKDFIGGRDATSSTGKSAGDKVAELYAVLNNSNDGGFVNIGGTKGDYIGGIQIPFNSTVNADGEKYKAMNFFMPTGGFRTLREKEATSAKSASSIIENTNEHQDFSFIKGAVTKATFVQMGGEPIYSFDIQFLPIDRIL
jgi:hypothetical protein